MRYETATQNANQSIFSNADTIIEKYDGVTLNYGNVVRILADPDGQITPDFLIRRYVLLAHQSVPEFMVLLHTENVQQFDEDGKLNIDATAKNPWPDATVKHIAAYLCDEIIESYKDNRYYADLSKSKSRKALISPRQSNIEEWLRPGLNSQRQTLLETALTLKMPMDYVNKLLLSCGEDSINYRDPEEAICAFCIEKRFGSMLLYRQMCQDYSERSFPYLLSQQIKKLYMKGSKEENYQQLLCIVRDNLSRHPELAFKRTYQANIPCDRQGKLSAMLKSYFCKEKSYEELKCWAEGLLSEKNVLDAVVPLAVSPGVCGDQKHLVIVLAFLNDTIEKKNSKLSNLITKNEFTFCAGEFEAIVDALPLDSEQKKELLQYLPSEDSEESEEEISFHTRSVMDAATSGIQTGGDPETDQVCNFLNLLIPKQMNGFSRTNVRRINQLQKWLWLFVRDTTRILYPFENLDFNINQGELNRDLLSNAHRPRDLLDGISGRLFDVEHDEEPSTIPLLVLCQLATPPEEAESNSADIHVASMFRHLFDGSDKSNGRVKRRDALASVIILYCLLVRFSEDYHNGSWHTHLEFDHYENLLDEGEYLYAKPQTPEDDINQLMTSYIRHCFCKSAIGKLDKSILYEKTIEWADNIIEGAFSMQKLYPGYVLDRFALLVFLSDNPRSVVSQQLSMYHDKMKSDNL